MPTLPINWINALRRGGGASYCDEYQAVYDSFTTKPSASVAAAQNTMVESMVSDGVWSLLDVFYLFAQESNAASEALINWKNPGTDNATIVNSGDMTFTSLEGFASGGTNGYINIHNPTDGTNWSANNASYGIYCRTDASELKYDCGVWDGTSSARILLRSGTTVYYSVNGAATGDQDPTTDARGFSHVLRVEANYQILRKNKTQVERVYEAGKGVPNADIFVCMDNNNGAGGSWTPTTKQYSCYYDGALTESLCDDITDAVEVYMDSNGKGIIT